MSKIDVPRWKNPADYTVEEIVAEQAARARGEQFRVETDAYKQARAAALSAAGLDADDDDTTPLEDMTAEQHYRRLQQAPKW